ncbi:MAG: ABC transporter substrate-binding protein [Erysipelotrichaceae bacterium]|nr:ABC transporter substrate-binding protein [Erysipelotrichaceae bacterium]
MKKLLVALLALMMFTACSSGSGSKNSESVKIGLNFELTGEVASYGNSEADAVMLAIKHANEDGGVLGKEIVPVKLDNQSDQAETVSVQTKLATVEKVTGIIGPAVSGLTAAVYPVANEYGVVSISASATADGITQDENGDVFDYAFRVCFLDSYQGLAMAKFVSSELGASKAVVIGDSSSDYAKGLSKSFINQFTSMGGSIVAEESYVEGDTEFNSVLTKIKDMDFDVIYIPGYYGEVSLIVKQARAMGINVPITGGDGFDAPELLQIAGPEALNDVYFTTAYTTVTTDSNVLDFVEAYKAEYNKDPDMFAALAYDAAGILIQAIEDAGSDEPEAVKDALVAMDAYQGVTGKISFDELHNAEKSVLVVELVDGVQANSIEVE